MDKIKIKRKKEVEFKKPEVKYLKARRAWKQIKFHLAETINSPPFGPATGENVKVMQVKISHTDFSILADLSYFVLQLKRKNR